MAKFSAEINLANISSSEGTIIYGKEDSSSIGRTVASAGDINGDGYADIILGAYYEREYSGSSYIVFGSETGIPDKLELSDLDGTNGFEIVGAMQDDYSGWSVASAGDVNGDGFDDIIIGARDASTSSSRFYGGSFVVFGKASGFQSVFQLSTLDGQNGFRINGGSAGDNFGFSVASAGDINKDGCDDLIIGAPMVSDNAIFTGASYIIYGTKQSHPSEINLSSLNGTNGFKLSNPGTSERGGYSVSSAGDFNGDGYADILIGATENGGHGAAYVVFGKPGSFATTFDLSNLDGNSGFKIEGFGQSRGNAHSVATAGDINKDGFDDIIISSFLSSGSQKETGSAYVIYGKAGGYDQTLLADDINGTVGFKIEGELALDRIGFSVSSAGDINGDGYDDMLVGAPFARTTDQSTETPGIAYVVFGKPQGFDDTVDLSQLDGTNGFKIIGVNDTDLVGYSVASAGDLNHDGFDDILIGAPNFDSPQRTNNGAAYVIYGQASVSSPFIGTAGDDRIEGSVGADVMIGLAGNDTYIVNNEGDIVTEAVNEGTDTIYTSVSYTLGDNVENLTLTGVYSLTIKGNALGNGLTGNSGSNTLYGYDGDDRLDGGAMGDVMFGGAGNDTYYVDSESDIVFERAGEGTSDRVISTISFTLGDDFENLLLGGTSNLNGTGNALDNTLIGNSGNNILDGLAGNDSMNGGSGDDIYVIDAAGDSVSEHDDEGTDTIRTYVSYELGIHVENLELFGKDDLTATGNGLDNVLTGNGGANILDGGLGADTMVGGKGNDTYFVDNAEDSVTEEANQGADTVKSSVSYTLGDNVENLTLVGSDSIKGTGNALENTLVGNDGDNALDGGTGADTMIGGKGDDIYYIDHSFDSVSENAGEGHDTVRSAVSFVLGDHLEDLILTGSGNLSGTGNDLNNRIVGTNGSNVIDGLGGADTMVGGKGNDIYSVDDADDAITEEAGDGIDTVRSHASFTLGDNVENIELLGESDIAATGNDLANDLRGNSGANTLDGGKGADNMLGGRGDDTYFVDNSQDLVLEDPGEGLDTVKTTISYDLTDDIENLVLLGSGNIKGTGNSLDNMLTGNAGNNTLNGGQGADTMQGGKGNDFYYVDNDFDTVIENVGEGHDTVKSSISVKLGENIEDLTLTGSDDLSATGNDLDNVIIGTDGDNIIDGMSGGDTMGGLDGDDIYIVDTAGDAVVEFFDNGIDTVNAYTSYGLSANVENLVLKGYGSYSATGNRLDNILIGNDYDNVIDGGIGADTMRGGDGSDTYVVDNAGDTVTEEANQGYHDTVNSSIAYTLTDNVEDLTLTGQANIDGTGNELDNFIYGNSGNNRLTAGLGNDQLFGGSGTDTLIGGQGDDSYYLYWTSDENDVIIENAEEGDDTVRADFSYTLGDNLENLVLVWTAGSITATGNTLDNRLYGNYGDNTLDGGKGADTMSGDYGNDVYIVEDSGDQVIEYYGYGYDTVRASIDYTLTANVENLVLTGDAALQGFGNELSNVLTGNAASNVLDGAAGSDTMEGGKGDDVYYVDNGGDWIIEFDNEGTDQVYASESHILGANVENITLTGSKDINADGNELGNVMTGNSGNNSLAGFLGDDVLNGGEGDDTMEGGQGDDTYYVDSSDDKVIENEDEGSDTIHASIAYTLVDNTENLLLMGDGDIDATGNDKDNSLTGNIGKNILDGGKGADRMQGGAGDDIYYVDNSGDVIVEEAFGGDDSVFASVSYSLAYSVNNLTLTGSDNINATGNSNVNILTGNSGNNVLDGGKGVDTMVGGTGDDTYYVDNVGDVIVEEAFGGDDSVFASVSYSLAYSVNNLTLTGTKNINATGNSNVNILTGNSGNNVLDGGTGADTMSGGTGNDTYIVDHTKDIVTELADSGTDTVKASIRYTLGDHVENLLLTGNANIKGTGNALDNAITGNEGNNALSGLAGNDTIKGGTGNDTITGGTGIDALHGGAGADIFLFAAGDTASEAENADTIYDFSGTSGDRIDLSLIDANEALSGNQAFSFLGSAAFTKKAGELRYEKFASDTYVSGDTNGDGTADFIIHLDDAVTLKADHFLL